MLSMRPKRPNKDKFNEAQFLADNQIFLSHLQNQKAIRLIFFAIKATAKTYAK